MKTIDYGDSAASTTSRKKEHQSLWRGVYQSATKENQTATFWLNAPQTEENSTIFWHSRARAN